MEHIREERTKRWHRDLAKALADNEKTIVGEFAAVQGKPADIDGYYWADVAKVEAIMRPSKTLNSILGGAAA